MIALMFSNLQRDRKDLFKKKGYGLEFAIENKSHKLLDKGDHAFFNDLFNPQEEQGTELVDKASSSS